MSKTTRKPAAAKTTSAIKYAVSDFARPTAGAALAAHTHAFLTLSGIADGTPFPKADAVKIMGPRAVGYHLREKGNFVQTDEGLTLSEKGIEFFLFRAEPDAELVAAYSEVLSTGKLNDKANVKTEASRVALK